MYSQAKVDNLKEKEQWAYYRSGMEKSLYKRSCRGEKIWGGIKLIDLFLPVFGGLLKLSGLFQKGNRNARNLTINQLDLINAQLPASFDGYKILYITDLHLDALAGIEEVVVEKSASIAYDLCLMGGDFRKKSKGRFDQILHPLQKILDHLEAPDGIFTAFGNHDTYEMRPAFERMGLNTLVDETISLCRNGESISITGVDDPHYYFTSGSARALAESGDGFKILLAHTPEICDLASNHGYQLYLCGHTHGGQICLPNGRALVTHLIYEKDKYAGLWRHGATTGYTSSGAGVSGLPIRFFCPPEIMLLTLRKNKP